MHNVPFLEHAIVAHRGRRAVSAKSSEMSRTILVTTKSDSRFVMVPPTRRDGGTEEPYASAVRLFVSQGIRRIAQLCIVRARQTCTVAVRARPRAEGGGALGERSGVVRSVFAEDTGSLPDWMFTWMLEHERCRPEKFIGDAAPCSVRRRRPPSSGSWRRVRP